MSVPDFIEIIDGALSPDVCRELITRFEEADYNGQTHKGNTAGGVKDKQKKSTDYTICDCHNEKWLGDPLLLKVYSNLEFHLKNYVRKYPLLDGNILKQKNFVGEEVAFNSDTDFQNWNVDVSNTTEYLTTNLLMMKRYKARDGGYFVWHSDRSRHMNGDRVLVCQYFLNDVSKGGETEFLYYNKKIKPKTGRLIIFPTYFTHIHRGNMPISFDKYILTSWIINNKNTFNEYNNWPNRKKYANKT